MDRQHPGFANPLKYVGKVSNDSAGEYRRALSAVEVLTLVEKSTPSRAWVYVVILYTGLRRAELNLLTWGDFHLDQAKPCVVLSSRITKNRKAATIYLRPEVVDALLRHRPDCAMPFEWVFRGKVPQVVKFKKDLAAAGIAFTDERGRRIDVHALRTTFCTMLSVAGVPPRVAMELMRHSELKLTMRVYTDASQLPLAAEVHRLPSFSLPENDAHGHAQIDAQTGVLSSHGESEAVAQRRKLATGQDAELVTFSPAESAPVATGGVLKMVGLVRFELTTSCTPCKRATRLRYSPNR